jgi:glycosyltransferase involved in cell wall biosynthesis
MSSIRDERPPLSPETVRTNAESDTARRPLLTLIVPLLDEEENVDALIGEIEELLPRIPGKTEVILIDDGSRDGSWRRIREAATRRPWLRARRFLGNRGQTAAMAAGIEAARGDIIGFLDADLQNDPQDVIPLLEPILAGTADVVCGWRRDRKDSALDRRIPSRIANYLLAKAFKLKLHDFGCTLKLFRREYLADARLFGEMHRFLPCFAQVNSARIVERVVHHRPRRAGTSKYGLERVGKILVDILTVKLLNVYGSKPGYFFGKIALLFFLLGTGFFGIVAYRTFALGRPEATPMVFMMLLMYITALLALLSGLLAEILVRILYEVGGGRAYTIAEEIGPSS